MRINFVEMFGLSGSGKSTLKAKLLQDNTMETAKPIRTNLTFALATSVFLIIKMLIISPINTLRILINPQGRRLLLRLGLRVFGIFIRRFKSKNNEIFLQDSGVIMPLVTSVIEENWTWTFEQVKLILKVIPIPDKVVFVSAPPLIAYERCIKRDKQSSYNQELFFKANDLCEFLLDFLKSKNIEVILMDNSETQTYP